jgi:hypothetical protein
VKKEKLGIDSKGFAAAVWKPFLTSFDSLSFNGSSSLFVQ